MSTAPRLFVGSALEADGGVSLSSDQARYLNQVLRKKPGDPVRIFNGRDGEYSARIADFTKHGGELVCQIQTRTQAPSPDVHLLFAPLKRQRTDMVVEKATELGASAIRPVFTARTNSDHVRTDRLRVIAIEAAEQTERLDIPDIVEPLSLEKVLDQWDSSRRLVFADEAGDDASAPWGGSAGRAAPIVEALNPYRGQSLLWAILIGPEGGFSPDERSVLRGLDYVTPVSLGPRILRAETAVLSALTIWQAILGDWQA